jgi:surface antigen
MFTPSFPAARLARASLVAAVLAATASGVGAQTYGTERGGCDRPAMSEIFSTSTNNLIGSGLGAVAGGLLGSQFGKGGGNTVMTVGGILAGALAGGYVGRAMEPADQGCVSRALENAPTRQTVAWRNPDSDTSYWVTPTRTYQTAQGTPCREFTTTAVIDGRREEVHGTACREPDGSWKAQDDGSGSSAQ